VKRDELKIFDFRQSEDPDLPFEIKTFRKIPPPGEPPPHRHRYYEIHYVTRGEGTHMIDYEKYEIQSDSLYFISPGQVHFIKRRSPIIAKVLLFTQDFPLLLSHNENILSELSFFHSLEEFPHLVLKEDQIPVIDNIIQQLENIYRSEGFGKVSLISSYMNILLIYIQRFYEDVYKPKASPKSAQLVRRFKQAISTSFQSEHSVEAYADSIGVSTGHLRDTVKTITGFTPGQMIRNRLIIEAKRLLLHTEMTVAEVGYALSFDDPSYFGRFFKRETNQSPKQFKKVTQRKHGL
jgi:AraC-like DNA-binding protein